MLAVQAHNPSNSFFHYSGHRLYRGQTTCSQTYCSQVPTPILPTTISIMQVAEAGQLAYAGTNYDADSISSGANMCK